MCRYATNNAVNSIHLAFVVYLFVLFSLCDICKMHESIRKAMANWTIELGTHNNNKNKKTHKTKRNKTKQKYITSSKNACTIIIFMLSKAESTREEERQANKLRGRITTKRRYEKNTHLRSKYTINIILCRLFADENLHQAIYL